MTLHVLTKTLLPCILVFSSLGLRGAPVSGSSFATIPDDPYQVEVVSEFLNTLDAQQRERAVFPFDNPQRLQWRRTPGDRTGVGFADLNDLQRTHAHQMLRSVLGTQGYLKAVNIMLNEDIQARVESSLGQDRYWIAVYGDPSATRPWGWRIEGHHLSLHFTFQGAQLISASPAIYGMHPAHIDSEGPRTGLRVLAGEEELARRLTRELLAAGFDTVRGQGEVPRSLHAEKASVAVRPEGVRVDDMGSAQKKLVRLLIAEYVNNYEANYAASVFDRLDLANLRFVWYGGLQREEGHYYRLQGDNFIIEYEHYGRNRFGGNHIHCLWRDLRNDFGF